MRKKTEVNLMEILLVMKLIIIILSSEIRVGPQHVTPFNGRVISTITSSYEYLYHMIA